MMSEMAKELIQQALDQDFNNANKTFNNIMQVKLADVLDQEQIRLADQIYNGVDPNEDEEASEEDESDIDIEDMEETEDEEESGEDVEFEMDDEDDEGSDDEEDDHDESSDES